LVIREALVWTIVGLAAGAAGARVLTRYLQSLLFRVAAGDAPTFIVVAVLLGLVAIAATAVPAIRAVRVDPMVALRSE
jgi:putative ABC transport system permease protein